MWGLVESARWRKAAKKATEMEADKSLNITTSFTVKMDKFLIVKFTSTCENSRLNGICSAEESNRILCARNHLIEDFRDADRIHYLGMILDVDAAYTRTVVCR